MLTVFHKNGQYNIYLNSSIVAELHNYISTKFRNRKAVIITDTTVNQLYGATIKELVCNSGAECNIVCIERGEGSKSLRVLEYVYSELCRLNITRSDLIIALGGGVVGDLTGLAAATFMRGISFISIPTTLLSQVDSCIGGKVAINLPHGKNLIGCFYHPSAVFICTSFLDTLEDRFFSDGLAEVIKYGCIKESPIIDILNKAANRHELMSYIKDIITASLKIKKEIVELDEFDTNIRMLLNFGHTIGHTIEKLYNYTTYTHGEAIGIGMAWITEKSEETGDTSPGTANTIKKLLERFSIPSTISKDIRKDILESIKLDKKSSGENINIVLLKRIGHAFIKNIAIKDMDMYI